MEYGDDGDNESKSNTFSRGLNRMLQHLAVHDITKPGKMVDFLVKQGLSADHDGSLAELVRADFAPLLKVDSNTGKPFATAEMVVILREAVKDEKLKAKLECSLAPHMILNPGAALNAGELSEAAFFHMMRDDKIARAEWLFDFSG